MTRGSKTGSLVGCGKRHQKNFGYKIHLTFPFISRVTKYAYSIAFVMTIMSWSKEMIARSNMSLDFTRYLDFIANLLDRSL